MIFIITQPGTRIQGDLLLIETAILSIFFVTFLPGYRMREECHKGKGGVIGIENIFLYIFSGLLLYSGASVSPKDVI
jgi:hypothetical protein